MTALPFPTEPTAGPPAEAPGPSSAERLAAVETLPTHRLREAREAATRSGWPRACPDPRCGRAGLCAGALRSLQPGGPRGFPGCLALALQAVIAPETLTQTALLQVAALLPDVWSREVEKWQAEIWEAETWDGETQEAFDDEAEIGFGDDEVDPLPLTPAQELVAMLALFAKSALSEQGLASRSTNASGLGTDACHSGAGWKREPRAHRR